MTSSNRLGFPSVSASRVFQCFARGPEGLYQTQVKMKGWLGEHEEKKGRLELFEHPLVAKLASAMSDEVPFREQVVEGGQEDWGKMVRWL